MIDEATTTIADDAFDLAFAAATQEPEDTEVLVDEPVVPAEPVVESAVPAEPAEPVAVAVPAPAQVIIPEPVVDTTAQDLADALAKETPTQDEIDLITQAAADFPEVIQALKIQERVLTAKFENILAKKIGEVASKFDQRIAPAEAVARESAKTKHDTTILEKHADAFTIVPKVEEWVATQPSFLQDTYNNILDRGSAAQIIEMLDTFKKATGAQAPPVPKIDVVKEKKLNAQEGVRGRHTGGRATVDPDDFDGAFEKFAAKA
jgi:vancomycin resistance protein YoaR